MKTNVWTVGCPVSVIRVHIAMCHTTTVTTVVMKKNSTGMKTNNCVLRVS